MDTDNPFTDNWSSSFTAAILQFPSRILNRLRLLDNPWGDVVAQPSDNPGYRSTTADANSRLHRRLRDTVAMPGPLGFASSGYFLGVIFMAFFLNRVQNIVAPSRYVTSYDRTRARRAFRQQLAARRATARSGWRTWLVYMRLILQSLFPVDFSSTRSRTIFRVPSVYLLLKTLLVWTVLLLQTSQIYPYNSPYAWVNALGGWVQKRSMDDICWSSFLSASCALFISSLTNGLEGLGHSAHAPFNLFGYAFILYIYSSPMTHVRKDVSGVSRPDTHILITMIMPLLQLTMTHILEADKRYARARLIPTTVTSVISLVHFHLVTFHAYFPSSSKLSQFTAHSYPLPTLVPSVVETFLICTILTTILLNAFTQLLTTGAIRGPLLSMIGHAGTLAPRWDEDFGVALFRLGTASLEATCVKGFGNEVGSINMGKPAAAPSRSPTQSRRAIAIKAQRSVEREGEFIEINRSGIVSVYSAMGEGEANGSRRQAILSKTKRPRGFWNEIKHVKASTTQSELWADSLLNMPWYRGLGRFVLQLWILTKGIWGVTRKRLMSLGRVDEEDVEEEAVAAGTFYPDERNRNGTPDADEEVELYEKFLRGDNLSDEDEDEEFDPDSRDIFETYGRQSGSGSDQEDGSEDDDETDDGELAVTSDTLGLYADLSHSAASSNASAHAPLLLAHMTSSSPLTRRRYSSLLQVAPFAPMRVTHPANEADSFDAFVVERRTAKMQERRQEVEDEAMLERQRNCVICTVEPRQIICWPCRCLALCDDCRENLASRSAASKHMCPCCRRNVDGFSKIYIP